MLDYLSSHLWLLWSLAALTFLIVELSSGDFYLTCLAIGSLGGVVVAAAGAPVWAQVLTAVVVSVASVLLIRPRLLAHLHTHGERKSNADALIGREAVVIESITGSVAGYVKVDGDQWRAVAADNATFNKGDRVRIVSRDSIIVTVTNK